MEKPFNEQLIEVIKVLHGNTRKAADAWNLKYTTLNDNTRPDKNPELRLVRTILLKEPTVNARSLVTGVGNLFNNYDTPNMSNEVSEPEMTYRNHLLEENDRLKKELERKQEIIDAFLRGSIVSVTKEDVGKSG